MIKYDKAVANVLPQLQQFFILPRHVWEPVVGANGKGLKNYDPGAHLPIVGAGSFFVTKYDKKGTTILERNPGFYGKKPHLDAVGITWFANADAMLAALKGGDLDYIDEVPFTVADQLGKSGDIQLVTGQGSEIRDFGFNSNPKKKKNRELLDPKLRDALSHAFDRKQIVDVVFRGHAAPRADAADADLGAVHEHEAPAREVRPRARQLEARQARLQEGIERHPRHARSRLAPDGLQRGHAGQHLGDRPRVRDRARLVRQDRRQADAAARSTRRPRSPRSRSRRTSTSTST